MDKLLIMNKFLLMLSVLKKLVLSFLNSENNCLSVVINHRII